MPTPRRPGDPHARGRGPTLVAAVVAALLSTTGAQVAAAAPAPFSASTRKIHDCFVQVISPGTPDSTATPTATPDTNSAVPVSPDASPAPLVAASPDPASAGTATATAPAPSKPAPRSGATPAAAISTPASKPPRIDGTYFGGTIAAGGSFARVNDFETPDPMAGVTTSLRVGQAIYPWMTIGLAVTGSFARRFDEPGQRLRQGAVLVDFGFLPVPRIPLSLRVGFGAGGGAVREAGRPARGGFGGAVFTGAVRYEIFPLAARKRPRRGGGFSLGPELGWLGFTPAAKGRPMSNTVYIGLFMGFYFGS